MKILNLLIIVLGIFFSIVFWEWLIGATFTIFAKVLIISIFCNGVRISLDKKMIFRFIWEFTDAYFPEYLKKPLTHCVYCFASTWGTLAYILQPNPNIYEWFICIVCAIWFNGFVYSLHE